MNRADLQVIINERKARIERIRLNIERLKVSIETRKVRVLPKSFPCGTPKLCSKAYEEGGKITWNEWKEESNPNSKDIERELAVKRYREHQELLIVYLQSTQWERQESLFLRNYIRSSFPACPYYLSEDEYYEQAIRNEI